VPLRVISFLEMSGITSRRAPQTILREALDRIAPLRHGRCFAALSPHAPYSTSAELLRLASRAAGRRGWRVCTHVAESAMEFAMFRRGEGEMFDWLKRSGRDMSDCGSSSPVRHLERCGALNPRLLAAHVNYLDKGDAARLRQHGVSVVHCPRSHDYFRHGPFPLRRLRRAGINVCLGTDSLASIYKTRAQTVELNLFKEMRVLASREPWLAPRGIVRMATLNGARALGMAERLGELKPRAFADVIALPFSGKISNVYDAVLGFEGKITASMIDGSWAVPHDE